MTSRQRRGIALVDLLVVVVGSILVIGLILPRIQSLREKEARSICSDRLRRIGYGSLKYASAHNHELPRNRVTSPKGSWNTEILPYVGLESLSRFYHEGKDWWDPINRKVVTTVVPTFLCPAAPHPNRRVLTANPDQSQSDFRAAATDFVGSAGAYLDNNQQENLYPGAMHHRKITRRIRLSDVQDGTSYTLFVVEMADKPNVWQSGKLRENRSDKPQMPALSGQWGAPNWNHLRSYSQDGKTPFGSCAVNCSNRASIYGFHPGGANVLFVDGSVRFLKAGMPQEALIALVSIAGGELLAPNDF